jgi:radical SAM superfamily enzyme YgiQ (UPF0313 family)
MPWKIKRRYRALLDREEGCITKTPGGRTRVALVYPNQYHIGMSNLGFQLIYKLLNEDPQMVCERAFLPSEEEIELLEKQRAHIFSLETQTPLHEFQIIAFSVTFENDCLNVLRILKLAGIPLRREEREDYNFPLVLAGGVMPSFNPEPLSDFIDAFIIGEGEEVLPELMPALKEFPELGREAFLKQISSVRGVYVPAGYRPDYDPAGKVKSCKAVPGYPEKVEKRFLEDLDAHPASSVVLSPDTEFGNMFLVEVGRGCSRQCSFCVVGHLWKPFRNRSPEVILREAERGLRFRKRIGLLGSAVCDHPNIGHIFKEINRMGGEVSTSSLQFESINQPLVHLLLKGGRKSITLAPETGSERLRRLVHKGTGDDKILEAAGLLFGGGLLNLRLYFQVGLPTETNEDVEAIATLTKRIKHVMMSHAKGKDRLGNITLSVSPFVPKPGTPFQWEAMGDYRELDGKIRHIKRTLSRASNVNVIHDVPKYSYIQGILARGDRRVGELLLKALHCRGDWMAALKEVNINPDFYVRRRRDRDEVFPWDHIDTGVPKEHLQNIHNLQ